MTATTPNQIGSWPGPGRAGNTMGMVTARIDDASRNLPGTGKDIDAVPRRSPTSPTLRAGARIVISQTWATPFSARSYCSTGFAPNAPPGTVLKAVSPFVALAASPPECPGSVPAGMGGGQEIRRLEVLRGRCARQSGKGCGFRERGGGRMAFARILTFSGTVAQKWNDNLRKQPADFRKLPCRPVTGQAPLFKGKARRGCRPMS